MKAVTAFPTFQRQRALPLWKLLAADNAPAVIAILSEHLYEADHMRASEFFARVEKSLEELRAIGTDMPSTAREYVAQWLAAGLLERTLPKESDEEVYSLTAASAEAVRFVTGMGRPRPEATESRLALVMQALSKLEEDTDADGERRARRLKEERHRLLREIEALESGKVTVLDRDTSLERVREILSLFEGLVGDFHRVKEQFEELHSDLRRQIMSSEVTRGAVLEDIFAGMDLIRSSAAGRTFFAFWRLLNDPEQTARLEEAIDAVLDRDFAGDMTAEERRALRFLRRSLLDKGSDVQETTRRLAHGLRCFVESRQYMEEHRLNRLIAEAMRAGMDAAAQCNAVTPTGISLSHTGFTPESVSQLQFYDPYEQGLPPPLEDGTAPPASLEAVGERILRSEINMRELRRNIVDVLSSKSQATVGEVLEAHPATQGFGSVIGLIELAFRFGHEGTGAETLVWKGLDGIERSASVKQLFFVKDTIDELQREY